MKRFTVSNRKRGAPKKFKPAAFANKLLLESGIECGKKAYVKYADGRLTIVVGKKPPILE